MPGSRSPHYLLCRSPAVTRNRSRDVLNFQNCTTPRHNTDASGVTWGNLRVWISPYWSWKAFPFLIRIWLDPSVTSIDAAMIEKKRMSVFVLLPLSCIFSRFGDPWRLWSSDEREHERETWSAGWHARITWLDLIGLKRKWYTGLSTHLPRLPLFKPYDGMLPKC